MVIWSNGNAHAFPLFSLFLCFEIDPIVRLRLAWSSFYIPIWLWIYLWQVAYIWLDFSKWLLKFQIHDMLSHLIYKKFPDFFFSVLNFQIISPMLLVDSFLLLLPWDLCWWAVVVHTFGHRIPEVRNALKCEATMKPPCGTYHSAA